MNEKIAEWFDVSDLVPWDENPRNNEHAVDEIANSIKRFGWTNPILARLEDKMVIAGHTRLKAAVALGMNRVPVRFLDVDPVQARLIAIADNKLGESADWNDELLSKVLSDFSDEDLHGLGFDDDELDRLLGEDTDTFDTVEDDAPEVEDVVHSVVGEVYQLGPHRLMCGDCTDKDNWNKLLQGDKVDMVFTDPPYGMFYCADWSSNGGRKYDQVVGDNDDFDCSLINCIFETFEDCKEIFVWGANWFADLLPERNAGSWFVWDKREDENFDKVPGSAFELCWSKWNHRNQIIRLRWLSYFGMQGLDKQRHHPTQKPVKLSEWFFEQYGSRGDIVADFYGGSGSTLLGCANTGRVARLIELEPKYCDVIRRRWTQYANDNGIEPGDGAL